MQKLKTFLREQVIFLTVAFVSFSSQPAIVWAQDINPVPFTEALSVSRGSVTPGSQNAVYLTQTDMCNFVTQSWGWSDCSKVDALIWGQVPGADTTIIEKPNSAGYVTFEDWEGEDKDAVIADIEENLRVGLQAQSKATGSQIEFTGWSVYPTLDREKQMMYYATNLRWDGQDNVNITATVFDRRGYVEFMIVPAAANVTAAETEGLITNTLASYAPAAGESYAAWTAGDKVAAVGAVGVLAALAGVQYSKGAATGLVAALLLILKKAWFVLLLPLIWLKGLFTRSGAKT